MIIKDLLKLISTDTKIDSIGIYGYKDCKAIDPAVNNIVHFLDCSVDRVKLVPAESGVRLCIYVVVNEETQKALTDLSRGQNVIYSEFGERRRLSDEAIDDIKASFAKDLK